MKNILIILLFSSCTTYTGVRSGKCGGVDIYSTYKKIPQPTFETFGGMWFIRGKYGSELISDTTGRIDKLNKPQNLLCTCK